MNIEEVRELFPYIKTGKIYFNHASTGPVSERVLNAVNAHLLNASTHKIDDFPTIMKTVDETKLLLAEYLNCSPERLAFLDNTTNGINVLANGLEWNKGDRILLNDLEFPANVYPFLNLEKKGVEVDFVKSHNGVVTAEDIINEIKDSTKLVSISQVQFLSGYRADTDKIGAVCRNRNIIFSVDAIQGLGAVRLDVGKDNIDFIASGTQKWLLGFQGFSFIYVSEELQKKMTPAYMGWLSVKDAWNLLDFHLTPRDTAEVFQTGTINTLGVFAFNASMKLFKEYGYDNVEKNILNNSEYLISQLKSINIHPIADVERKNLSGIVTFIHPDAQRLYERLQKEDIICAVREGALRIAPHFYNTKEEIDRFVLVLGKSLSGH
jgi:cysteine desulfurase / selenocysteine lyase